MSCTLANDMLSAYVDGELAPQQSAEVAEHLTSCARCAQEYEATLKTVQMLRAGLSRAHAPDVLKARIRSALREERPAPAVRARREARMPWRAIAAALVIALSSSALTYVATRTRASQSTVAEDVL